MILFHFPAALGAPQENETRCGRPIFYKVPRPPGFSPRDPKPAKALLGACQFGLALGQGQPRLFGFLAEPAVKSLVLPIDSKLPEIIGQLCLHLRIADRYPFFEVSNKSAFGERAEWARLAWLQFERDLLQRAHRDSVV